MSKAANDGLKTNCGCHDSTRKILGSAPFIAQGIGRESKRTGSDTAKVNWIIDRNDV